jgi:DMSO reductase anchor subunit
MSNVTNNEEYRRTTPFSVVRAIEWIFFALGCLLTISDFIVTHGQNLFPARILVIMAFVSKMVRWYLAVVGYPTAIPTWRSALAAIFMTFFCLIGGKYVPSILQNNTNSTGVSDIIVGNDQSYISDINAPDIWDSLNVEDIHEDANENQ